MSITEERKKAVTFSDPYYTSGLAIIVRNDENNIKSLKDLEGKTISVQIGTTGADKAASVPGAKVKTFNTNAEVFLELNNKNADAVIIDRPVGAYFLTKEARARIRLSVKRWMLNRMDLPSRRTANWLAKSIKPWAN